MSTPSRRTHRVRPAASACAILAVLAACSDAPVGPHGAATEARTFALPLAVAEGVADARVRALLGVEDAALRERLSVAVAEFDEALRAGQRQRAETAARALLPLLGGEESEAVPDGAAGVELPVRTATDDAAATAGALPDLPDLDAIRLSVEAAVAAMGDPANTLPTTS